MNQEGYDSTVFSQWSKRPADERFTSLPALKNAVQSRYARSKERVIELSQLTVEPVNHGREGIQVVSREIAQPLVPTHWAFSQLCTRVGAPAGHYRKDLSSELVAANMNYLLRNAEEQETMLYYSDLDDDMEVYQHRASTGPKYGRIPDLEVVNLCERIVDMSDGAFYNPKEWGGTPGGLYASDSDVFLFFIDGGSIVDGGGERDQLHRGFYLWNSEVGKKTMGGKIFYFQECCGNYQIWGQQTVKEISIRHSLNAMERFTREDFAPIKAFLESSTADEEACIRRAKGFELPTDEVKRLEFVVKQGFTKPEAKEGILAAELTIGECKNLWQLMDGITMSARKIVHVDTKLDLETRSGKLMALCAN